MEFEFRASPKVLYQYIAQPSGLQQWFASKVNVVGDHRFDLVWDGESHMARQSIVKSNKQSKFEFDNGNYVDFRIDSSELTGTTYLTITDFSEENNLVDLTDTWEDLIYNLKEIVGH